MRLTEQHLIEKVMDERITRVVLMAHSQGGIIVSTWVVSGDLAE
jgi:alpha-beta hydrolase superfamily lysophospholipase